MVQNKNFDWEKAAEALYGKNKDNIQSKERNFLLSQLKDKLSSTQILYSSNEDLRRIKNEYANTKNSNNMCKLANYCSKPIDKPKYYSNTWDNDEDFKKAMKFVFKSEGGYSNRKEDRGGETNLGITQKTLDWIDEKHKRPKRSVKDLTKEDATRIYYEDFWKASGADKMKDKALGLVHFDAAVNHGVSGAKKYYQQSGGDWKKYVQVRMGYYTDRPKEKNNQKIFQKGWFDRMNNIQNYIDKNY